MEAADIGTHTCLCWVLFSFGVLALVVATGRRPYVPVGNDEEYLVDWVWSMHETQGLMEAVDARLAGIFDKDQVLRVLQVGLLCTHPEPKARLTTGSLLQALRGDTSHVLLQLPKSRPVAVYLTMFATPPDSQVTDIVPCRSHNQELNMETRLLQDVDPEEMSVSLSSTFTSEKSNDISSSTASQTPVTSDKTPLQLGVTT